MCKSLIAVIKNLMSSISKSITNSNKTKDTCSFRVLTRLIRTFGDVKLSLTYPHSKRNQGYKNIRGI